MRPQIENRGDTNSGFNKTARKKEKKKQIINEEDEGRKKEKKKVNLIE